MCECFGTTQPFFRYTCASISWSPVIRRRERSSCSSSRGMSSQRYHVAARLALTAILLDRVERQRYRLPDSTSSLRLCHPLGSVLTPCPSRSPFSRPLAVLTPCPPLLSGEGGRPASPSASFRTLSRRSGVTSRFRIRIVRSPAAARNSDRALS